MSGLSDLYQEILLEHNSKPRNFKALKDANQTSEGYNPLCGDQITLSLKVVDGVIDDVGFQGSGCAISRASASMMTQRIKGQSVEQAGHIFDAFHQMITEPEGEIDLDTLAVVRKADYRERRLQPLSVVRPRIVQELRGQRAFAALELEGASFVDQLQKGSILWSQELIDRGWQDQPLPLSEAEVDDPQMGVRSLIYAAPPPGQSGPVYGSGWIDDGKFIVYQLSAVIDGDPSAASVDARAQVQALIMRRDGEGLLASFQKGLRAAADVMIYPDQL